MADVRGVFGIVFVLVSLGCKFGYASDNAIDEDRDPPFEAAFQGMLPWYSISCELLVQRTIL